MTPEELDRLRGPIGLDLGGRLPSETALAILAEVVAERRAGTGRPMRDLARDGPGGRSPIGAAGVKVGAVVLAAGARARFGARQAAGARSRAGPSSSTSLDAVADAGLDRRGRRPRPRRRRRRGAIDLARRAAVIEPDARGRACRARCASGCARPMADAAADAAIVLLGRPAARPRRGHRAVVAAAETAPGPTVRRPRYARRRRAQPGRCSAARPGGWPRGWPATAASARSWPTRPGLVLEVPGRRREPGRRHRRGPRAARGRIVTRDVASRSAASADRLESAWAQRVRENRDQAERFRETQPPDFYAPVSSLFVADPRRTDEPALAALLRSRDRGQVWLDIGAGRRPLRAPARARWCAR